MEINKEWIAEQRAICDAATPGPWTITGAYSHIIDAPGMAIDDTDFRSIVADVWEGVGGAEQRNSNVEFIAAARTSLPAALDALEAAQTEIIRLKERCRMGGQLSIALRKAGSQREAEKDAEIERLNAELAAETRRADAAVYDLNLNWDCESCGRSKSNGGNCGLRYCSLWMERNRPPQYVWRGPCAENAPEAGK